MKIFFVVYWSTVFLVVFAGKNCDKKSNEIYYEGNIGEVSAFPWLGILRVHIHENQSFKVGVTRLLLIKHRFAIASAGDVVKVTRESVRRDTIAMFIIKNHESSTYQVVDYRIHPDYGLSVGATIALVELDMNQEQNKGGKRTGGLSDDFPTPICWPNYSLNTSNELYALGYTDENMLLEKIIYKLQYADQNLCSEFYNRVGFKNLESAPEQYHCGFPPNNKKHCDWDNGMVLASNASGYWNLVGFGIRSPGCSAPARFIDMLQHKDWVDVASNNN